MNPAKHIKLLQQLCRNPKEMPEKASRKPSLRIIARKETSPLSPKPLNPKFRTINETRLAEIAGEADPARTMRPYAGRLKEARV